MIFNQDNSDLIATIEHYNAREQVDISELTDSWLLQADNGEYMVGGSSATGSFLNGVDHNYGILKVVLSPDYRTGISPYGYIVYFSNMGNVYHREYRRDSNAIVWRGSLIRIANYNGLYYAANDTFSTYAGAVYDGIATHSQNSAVADELIFDVEVPKSLENISTITVTSMSGGMRGANGWIDFQGNKNWASLSGYTVTGTKIDDNRVRVVVLKDNKASFVYYGGSNLPVESLASYWGGITFKFT